MKFIPKDVYGTPIVNGAKVAYNYQGEVRLGTVLEVKETAKYGKKVNEWTKEPYVVIHIDMQVMVREGPHKSKVGNPKNLVVIK